MLAKFRQYYPQGSLVSELVKIDRGTYIVKASVEIEGIVIATALSGAQQVETAEDNAKERALASLLLDHESRASNQQLEPVKIQNMKITTPTKDETKLESSPQPVILANSLQQSFTPATKETSASDDISLKIDESNLESAQNVNFYKAESEPIMTTDDTTHGGKPLVPFEERGRVHSNIASSEIMADHSVLDSIKPQEQKVSPPVINNNLFGDTFDAEIPDEVSLSTQNADVPTSSGVTDSEVKAMDFNEIKQKTDIEIKRLGWTKERGKEFLMSRYGKRSRLHLTDEQLLEFLLYLEKLPNPTT